MTSAQNSNSQGKATPGPRSLEDAKRWMLERVETRIHPMGLTEPVKTRELIAQLRGLDGDRWVDAWGTAGDAELKLAADAEARGDAEGARANYLQAYGFYFLGRFPCPNHPRKLDCAHKARGAYLAAFRTDPHPIQRVVVPFDGRAGEGKEIAFLYRRPKSIPTPPVVIMWGGVDAWKEESTALSNTCLAAGLATVAMDNAGTGESPVHGSADAERQFLPVIEWAAQQSDLDGKLPALLGRSFGGYWATKLAHLYPQRIAAAVSWGGGAHYMFQRDWIEQSRYPDSYLMELVETRCQMLGAANDQEYIDKFAALSLLDQGLLDRPSAPLLLVNGKDDRQCPVDDIFLLLDHGSPKSVRFFPGGHMGNTPRTVPTMVEWLKTQLQRATES